MGCGTQTILQNRPHGGDWVSSAIHHHLHCECVSLELLPTTRARPVVFFVRYLQSGRPVKKPDVCRATIFRMASHGELVLVTISERATRVAPAGIERAIAEGKARS
jgi:hypothetical protein